jgi:hypothetical protein
LCHQSPRIGENGRVSEDHDDPPRDYTVTRSGPSAMECIAAAMRADPSLTLERAVTEVPVSAEALERYEQAAEARWLAEFGPVAPPVD